MKEEDFRAARILRAIGDPVRFQILQMLREKALNPTGMAERLGRNVANVSQHLRVLRSLDLVRFEQKGTQCVYRIKSRDVYALLRAAERCARGSRQVS